MISLKDRRRSAVSIATEIEEVGGQSVSAHTIRRTQQEIGVHGCHHRRKLLLKTIHIYGGFSKGKVEVHKVSNIHQLRDVVMEEWKSIPLATCEALVNSMQRRVKSIQDNDGGHTKY